MCEKKNCTDFLMKEEGEGEEKEEEEEEEERTNM
jgi:hypothetical protein